MYSNTYVGLCEGDGRRNGDGSGGVVGRGSTLGLHLELIKCHLRVTNLCADTFLGNCHVLGHVVIGDTGRSGVRVLGQNFKLFRADGVPHGHSTGAVAV